MRIDLANTTKDEIVAFAKKYVENEVLNIYPAFKDNISVILTGSIAINIYDVHSDIDLNFIFPQNLFDENKTQLTEYKRGLVEKYPQIQPFFKDTYENLQMLLEWENDLYLREIATGIIIYDPANMFSDFQQKIRWYPENVLKEKINWLYAELVFELVDRWKVALERKDLYFIEVTKIRIIQLIVNTIFLLNKQYPVGNKQLYKIFQKQPNEPQGIKSLIDSIINSHNSDELSSLFENARKMLEDELLKKNLIPEQEIKYWVNARPKYCVEM